MLYLRFLVISFWFVIAFGIGFVMSLLRWGDNSVDHFTAGLFGRPILRLLGITLQVEGKDELEKHQPCIYVANHQGALDILTFGSFFPRRTVVVGKKEIAYIPVLNLFFVAAGNVLVDRQKRTKAVASLGKAVKAIREKKSSVWVFPEGTRNRTDEAILPLKKGAFYMAVEAQVPIVPVISAPIRSLVNWEEGRHSRGVLRIRVLPPIQTRGMNAADVDGLAKQVRSVMIEAVRGLSA